MDKQSNLSPSTAKALKPRFRSVGRKDAIVDRVVDAIENEILAGRLFLGARLPSERELAERLSVSRTVLREAVRILVTRGLLETRHGIGTSVRAITRDHVTRPLTLFIRTSREPVSIEHLHQVRSMLEVGNAGLAADQATALDLEDLRRILAEMEAASVDPHQFALKDGEFHLRIARSTHNPLSVLLLDSMSDLMAEIRTQVARRQGLYERVMPTHTRVFECIAARDADGARKAMREHVDVALAIQRELIAAAGIATP